MIEAGEVIHAASAAVQAVSAEETAVLRCCAVTRGARLIEKAGADGLKLRDVRVSPVARSRAT
jgi:hypothetical protein